MAGSEGYSVGNLKIAFNALDQTSDDFKKLATNLRAVANLINRISTADLGKFTANVKQITQAFNPFLTKIEKSSDGIKKLNDSVSKVGVGNVSNVAQNFDDLQNKAQGAAESAGEFKVEIKSADEATRGAADSFSNFENKTEEVIDTFDKAQAQIAKLTKEMLNLHFDEKIFDKEAISQIQDYTDKITATQNALKEALRAEQMSRMSEEERTKALQDETIAQYNAEKAERKRLISYYEAKIATAKAGENVREYRKELERLRKEDGQVGKKSGFQKFLGQVKRIAIYRLIRSGLKAVTGAFKDGIGALAQFDSGVNKTMSQFTTSFTVMKLSVSMALLPLLQAITPIIQQISVGFANMANVISASMSKTGKFTKINTDRLLAYNKAANLFDFDKFRSLNKGDEASNLLSTENVEDFNDELGSSKLLYSGIFDIIKAIGEILRSIVSIVVQIVNAATPILGVVAKVLGFVLKIVGGIVSFLAEAGLIEPILYGILTTLTLIGISKIVTWIQGGGLTKALQGLIGLLKQFPTLLSNINKFIHTTTGKFALWGIAIGAVVAAVQILSNWDDFSRGTKIAITVISSLVAVLTTAAIAALALKGALTSGIAVPLIVTAVAAGATAIGGMIKGYANGGMPDKGSLFVAGERGAEFVYNMPSGQSGVANVQQIAQAMKAGCLAALQEYGASRGDLGDISFDLDGEQIYRNTTSHAKKHGYAWRKV